MVLIRVITNMDLGVAKKNNFSRQPPKIHENGGKDRDVLCVCALLGLACHVLHMMETYHSIYV